MLGQAAYEQIMDTFAGQILPPNHKVLHDCDILPFSKLSNIMNLVLSYGGGCWPKNRSSQRLGESQMGIFRNRLAGDQRLRSTRCARLSEPAI